MCKHVRCNLFAVQRYVMTHNTFEPVSTLQIACVSFSTIDFQTSHAMIKGSSLSMLILAFLLSQNKSIFSM